VRPLKESCGLKVKDPAFISTLSYSIRQKSLLFKTGRQYKIKIHNKWYL